ncbi:uncharacterized protein PV09_05982 [Verruconis gallopava]|uniref:Uncharacterized protein n=1 Tax=Verruconis gallopava TaxID=253628 RepID=A0A0D1XKT0_9PEZI|nr:uncharacterized protein PV09_05982 [Verruconis gallopava]KIW02936.1 hypothetical protein PV09_05982 [Verruconis gallopava]
MDIILDGAVSAHRQEQQQIGIQDPNTTTDTTDTTDTRDMIDESQSKARRYGRPSRRDYSPEDTYRRDRPDVTVYSSRPRSHHAPARSPRKEYIVTRSGTTKTRSRKDSLSIDERMRLLDIRDRFRDEVEKVKQWQPSTRSYRPRRDYDRRSSYY